MNKHVLPITAAKSAPAASGNTGAVPVHPLSGAAPTPMQTCDACDGFGEVEMLALDATRPAIVVCDCCEGSGEVPAACLTCQGSLVEGWCRDCDDFGAPDSVAETFARLFGSPLDKPEDWERIVL